MINKKLLQNRTFQILVLVSSFVLSASWIPLHVQRAFYALSLTIRDILVLALPFIVGVFVSHTISSFRHAALYFVFALVVFEGLSNFLSVWYAYGSARLLNSSSSFQATHISQKNITPLWLLEFETPPWWTVKFAVITGLFIGLINAFYRSNKITRGIDLGKLIAERILKNIFARLIPLFILGFVVHLYHSDIFSISSTKAGAIFIELFILLGVYIFIIFLVGANFSFSKAWVNLKHLLPAGGVAFTTGCSLSTMPWTIDGASKTMEDPSLARAIIPTTTNIQQVGDCIVNAFLCCLLYAQFYGSFPSMIIWLQFSIVFTLARFATAAIMGGAIFLMLPIYKSYLGFNDEMVAIILAFNVILDPLVTSSNTIANGGLCRVFEKFWDKLRPIKK